MSLFPEAITKLNLLEEKEFSFYELGSDGIVVFTQIDKGRFIPVHSHKKIVCNFVTHGCLEIDRDGRKEIIRQGNWFEVPVNCRHSLQALEYVELIEVWPYGFDE